ncbi:ribonuclease III domain-containing protein [Sedimentibacter sp.]|uniref:Mini-ribonuclease 3 n=1 Tax=Sedimentibacter sp. TaxID=1960295 RepID=UPI00289FD2A9|nr:ribonuclease III domain-containing protein [Sedimentibacter sp.]
MEENKLNKTTDQELLRSLNSTSDSTKNYFMYSSAQLAYAGDAVYELLVRSYIIHNNDINVNKMHKLSVNFVKANSQAYVIGVLEDELTEEEKRIVKRGRNAKITSSPKNAEMMEYRYATGFEALFGYLYLSNDINRLMTLFNRAVSIINEKDEKNEDN